jgi:transposase
MKKEKFDIYKCINNFPDDDLKELYQSEKCRRMGTRLLSLYHLKNGKKLTEVMDITLASECSIRAWTKKYADAGFLGLLEGDGRGRYPKLPKEKESEAIEEINKMQAARDGGRIVGHELQEMLIKKFDVKYCLRSIYVLLDRLGFSWISCRSKHPKTSQEAIETFKEDFPDIVKEIKKENPKLKFEIWWQDEMRIGQQGSLSRVWAPKGTRPRVVRQRQFLSTYIFGACCPDKDKACGLILPRVDTDMMQMHLQEISKSVEKEFHALILVDRASWHTTEQIQLPKNITLIPLPPYSPELNPMEQLWQQLRKIKLSNTAYDGYEEIVEAAVEAWVTFTDQSGAVQRLCSRDWAKIPN